MKCGKRLPDKKLTTLREHQEKQHPMSAKEKRSAFLFKHMLIAIMSLVVIVTVTITVLPDILFEDNQTESLVDLEVCRERTIALKSEIWQQGEFLPINAEELNYLMVNCNASFWSYKYGETIFESDYYSPDKIAERETGSLNLDDLGFSDVKSVGGE